MQKDYVFSNSFCKSCKKIVDIKIKNVDENKTLNEIDFICPKCHSKSIVYSSLLDRSIRERKSEKIVQNMIQDISFGYKETIKNSIYDNTKSYSEQELKAIIKIIQKEKLRCVQKKKYSSAADLRDAENEILGKLSKT